MKTLASIALAGLLAGSAVPAGAQTFLGVSYFYDQLVSIDGATGLGTQIGSLTPGASPSGLAASGGNLYTFDSSTDRLLQISPTTGATLASTDVGIDNAFGQGSLAFNSAGQGFFYSPLDNNFSTTNALYEFTPGGAPATLVGTTSDNLTALAFSADGTLYGLGKGDGDVFTFNTSTGASTLVGNLGVGLDPTGGQPALSSISALTFSGSTLFASVNDQLYTVNTSTGAASPVAPVVDATGAGFSSISGLVPADSVPAAVPEASTVVSFGALLALGGLLIIRRRKLPAA